MIPSIHLASLTAELISAASLNVFAVDVPTRKGVVRFECEKETIGHVDHWVAYADKRPPITECSLLSLINALHRRSTLKSA